MSDIMKKLYIAESIGLKILSQFGLKFSVFPQLGGRFAVLLNGNRTVFEGEPSAALAFLDAVSITGHIPRSAHADG